MKKELTLKKCSNCGAFVKVIKDCNCNNCGIKCCDDEMMLVKSNSTDAAFEKHVPTYERKNGKLIVSVNHVMEKEHYIEWICLITNDREEYRYFKPNDQAVCEFEDASEGIIYSYCNKHSLWQTNIE